MWLYELTSKRGNEIDRISSKTGAVMEHLIKIWLFPKYHDVNTWIVHTRKALYETTQLKRNKFLDHDTILNITYGEGEKKIAKIRDSFVEDHVDYGEYPGYMRSNYDDTNLLKSCLRKYFDGLATILSEDGFIVTSEVRKLIANSGLLDIPKEDR